MSPAEAFDILRSALEQAGIRYAIGGSWASTAFGEPRFTNDVDILAEVTEENLALFLRHLPETFYADAEEALSLIRRGRPFLNVIHMPSVLKLDLFPSSAFPLGSEELDRAVSLEDTGLSKARPAWFVTPEDILLAKLYWFKLGGEVSEAQWRDIMGIVRGCSATLDRAYLERAAFQLEVRDLLHRSLGQTQRNVAPPAGWQRPGNPREGATWPSLQGTMASVTVAALGAQSCSCDAAERVAAGCIYWIWQLATGPQGS